MHHHQSGTCQQPAFQQQHPARGPCTAPFSRRFSPGLRVGLTLRAPIRHAEDPVLSQSFSLVGCCASSSSAALRSAGSRHLPCCRLLLARGSISSTKTTLAESYHVRGSITMAAAPKCGALPSTDLNECVAATTAAVQHTITCAAARPRLRAVAPRAGPWSSAARGTYAHRCTGSHTSTTMQHREEAKKIAAQCERRKLGVHKKCACGTLGGSG